jgi:hypothetical protein
MRSSDTIAIATAKKHWQAIGGKHRANLSSATRYACIGTWRLRPVTRFDYGIAMDLFEPGGFRRHAQRSTKCATIIGNGLPIIANVRGEIKVVVRLATHTAGTQRGCGPHIRGRGPVRLNEFEPQHWR